MNLFGWNLTMERIKRTPPFYTAYQILNNKTPIIVDTSLGRLWNIYLQIPHLRIVINRKAEMFKNMDIKLRNKKTGEEVENHPVLSLLKKPTPLQSQEQWISGISIIDDVYSNVFLYELKAFSDQLPAVLWQFDPSLIKINPTGKLYEQTKLDGIISSYEILANVSKKHYKPEEIIQISNDISVENLRGISKVETLTLPLSNILGALKTRNILINDKGAVGILSSKVSDEAGGVPLSDSNRKIIENDYRKTYGIEEDQSRIVISPVPVQWSPMSYPTRDLMLFEEIEDDFAAICGAYGMSRDLFPSIKGATFENQNIARKSTYENTIQPAADSLTRIFNDRWKEQLGDLELIADYSWLPVMQEDKQKEQSVRTARVFMLSTMLKDGVIDKEEYANQAGVEYKEVRQDQSQADKIADAQVELRGTVEGASGLVEINRAVSSGELDRNTAVNIVMNIYGFDLGTAAAMVTNIVNKSKPENNNDNE